LTSKVTRDDDEDLFGSDSEEEDPAVVAERNKRLEEYKAKKETRPSHSMARTLASNSSRLVSSSGNVC
jgi:hypothetical protein